MTDLGDGRMSHDRTQKRGERERERDDRTQKRKRETLTREVSEPLGSCKGQF